MQGQTKAFTIIEIMVTIAVIAILSVVFVPNILRARQTTNTTTAAASCRTICNACNLYAAHNSLYPQDLSDLVEIPPPYIEPKLAEATSPQTANSGYYYTYEPNNGNMGFSLKAKPINNIAGSKQFLMNEGCIIHYYEGTEREVQIGDPSF